MKRTIIENEKGKIGDLDYRNAITKVRGGWTKAKIIKEIKRAKNSTIESMFYKEIAKFDTPEEFAESLKYHGSARPISILKPSIVLKNFEDFSGGSGEQYYGVSLSSDRNIASNFTGAASSGNVAPVLIKRNAVIKEMPELKDAIELEDIIEDLWAEGIDAVVLGDQKNDNHGEKETVILNTRCISVGKPTYFQVYNKKEMPSWTKEELTELWLNSSDIYKKMALESWDRQNEKFTEKHGRSMNVEHRWNSKQRDLYNFHKHNVELYKQNLELSNTVEDLIKSKNEKPEKKSKKTNKPR
tara:strand:+ start:13503 stop:14399 length:897 start_codon:yes stop_codon:yes gene_type:complete